MKKLIFFAFIFLTSLSGSSQTEKKDTLAKSTDITLQQKIDSIIKVGNTYFMKGDPESLIKSIECYDKVIRLNPNFARAYFNRGNSNIQLGLTKEACKDYKKAKSLGHPMADEYIQKFCN